MTYLLKDKVMIWMKDQDDSKNHSLSLGLMSGDLVGNYLREG
jgi:hypothetical protein